MNTSISIGSQKITFRVEILILIIVVGWILFGHLLCGCSKISMQEGFSIINSFISNAREGFAGNNAAYSAQFANFKKNDGVIRNTDTWEQPTLFFTPGEKSDKGVQSIWNRKPQPIPLPKGELDMFATTPFKPECCPNTYSNSMGCACMTVGQYDALRTRFGNNVPYSEY